MNDCSVIVKLRGSWERDVRVKLSCEMMGCEIQATFVPGEGGERETEGGEETDRDRERDKGGGEKGVTEKTEIYSIWKGADTLISNIGPQSI